jgi:PKD repeat protein
MAKHSKRMMTVTCNCDRSNSTAEQESYYPPGKYEFKFTADRQAVGNKNDAKTQYISDQNIAIADQPNIHLTDRVWSK